jgi:hypothetical protein
MTSGPTYFVVDIAAYSSGAMSRAFAASILTQGPADPMGNIFIYFSNLASFSK